MRENPKEKTSKASSITGPSESLATLSGPQHLDITNIFKHSLNVIYVSNLF